MSSSPQRLFILLGLGVVGISISAWIRYSGVVMPGSTPEEPPLVRLPSIKHPPAEPLMTEEDSITVQLPARVAPSAGVSAAEASATAAAVTGEPAKLTGYRAVLAERDQWFAEHIIAPARARTQGKPWQADALAWLPEVWRYEYGHPNAQQHQELFARGNALLAAGCNDPAVVALVGLIHPEQPHIISLISQGLGGLTPDSGSAGLQARLHLKLAWQSRPNNPQELAKVVTALIAGKDAGDFSSDAGGAELISLVDHAEDNLDPYLRHVANRLCDGKQVPPWATATLLGRLHIALAWRYRGSGWADSVTDDGWRGFARELADARTALETAVALAPQRSEPRALLLTVIMGEGGDTALARLQQQFAASQTACPDHLDAARRYINALRPRWFGDHETMLKLGLEWTASKAYDSYLPWIGLNALDTIDNDLDSSGEVYGVDGVTSAIEQAAAGYLAAPVQLIATAQLHAKAFRAEFLGGDFVPALVHLRALGGDPASVLDGEHRFDSPHLTGMCELGAIHRDKAVTQLIRSQGREAPAAVLQRLTAATDLTPASRTWITHLQAAENTATRFRSGAPLLFPDSAGLVGWEALQGAWRVADGAFVCDSGYLGHLLVGAAPIGERFVLSGAIEITNTSNGAWQTGVVFGSPRKEVADSRGWGSVRFRGIGNGFSAEISNGFSAPAQVGQIVTPKQNRFTFRIAIADNRCTVDIQGQRVFNQVQVPDRVALDAGAHVGLGAYVSDNTITVRYSKLLLLREPASVEPEAPGAVP